jgi:hypothetical protein
MREIPSGMEFHMQRNYKNCRNDEKSAELFVMILRMGIFFVSFNLIKFAVKFKICRKCRRKRENVDIIGT